MREIIDNHVHNYYWQEDYSCAVTTLKILAELFGEDLHPQVIKAAFGLNAGRCGLKCGLVEGTLLFMGVYASHKHMEDSKITEVCREYCAQFQAKFGSLQCSELRPQGFKPDNPPHLCEEITKQAVAFAAAFLKETIAL